MVESGPMSSTKAIPLMPLAAPSVAQTRARTCGGSEATLRLTARATDRYGQALTVPVAWSVDLPGVAAVDSAGLVTARSNGTAVVTATAGGVSGSATVTVAQAPGA